MYPGAHIATRAQQPAVIMAGSGEVVTYGALEARSNRLAHLMRAHGLRRLDHYAVFMENNVRLSRAAPRVSAVACTTRPPTPISPQTSSHISSATARRSCHHLAGETRRGARRPAALSEHQAVPDCRRARRRRARAQSRRCHWHISRTRRSPTSHWQCMLYSSGTTGRPKGILRPLPEQPPGQCLPVYDFLANLWQFRDGLIYLSPAPLYHAAPHVGVNLTIRMGGTAIIMEHFDAAQFLQLIEQYRVTHSQLVPTMFSRLLKLPDEQRRCDLSSLEIAIHAAAPCPVQVKQQMIDWWGPIIFEYYGMTEANGVTVCDSPEWLAHRGTVGRVLFGELHILDEEMREVPPGTIGTVWFRLGSQFEYFNDPERTKRALSPDGTMGTVGDIGYVDGDGYLYLTDRNTFMIISGGVNIYPQECEDLLITHPKVRMRQCSACPTRISVRRSRRRSSSCPASIRAGDRG